MHRGDVSGTHRVVAFVNLVILELLMTKKQVRIGKNLEITD